MRSDERATKAAQLLGIGPLTASALVATVDDFSQFKNARQFGAWLGLVPSQNSTGGKARLGRITKRGDDYLRTLLIQGAKSAVMTADKRQDRISQWLVQPKERVVGKKPWWRWPPRTRASCGRCSRAAWRSTLTMRPSPRTSGWRSTTPLPPCPESFEPKNSSTSTLGRAFVDIHHRLDRQQVNSVTLARRESRPDHGERMQPC